MRLPLRIPGLSRPAAHQRSLIAVPPPARASWTLRAESTFPQLWYDARSTGETTRAEALHTLYTARAVRGGAYPDPRLPAAFSERAILATVARLRGLTIWQAPPDADELAPSSNSALVWLMTHPNGQQPTIMTRYTPDQARLHFELACLLGYVELDRARLLSGDAPASLTFLPTDPQYVAILHQYAIAMLCRAADCPSARGCICNSVRTRFNRPPADHDQPTDILTTQALTREIARQRREHAS